MNYTLDACAMLALIFAEPGDTVVWQHLTDPNNTCFAHAINPCEVYYDIHRTGGEKAAEEAIADLKSLGVVERNDILERCRQA
jgi:PIN domain nuclease of toxin-antitoxin system